MCDPITIASLGAQAVATGIQNNATRAANRGMAGLMDQNRQNNRALEDSQRAAIQQATTSAGAQTGKQGMADAGDQLSQILKSAIVNAAMKNNAPGQNSGPKIVQDANAAAAARARAAANQRAAAIAKLDATNQYLQTTVAPKLADAQAAGQLTGNFMRGNSNVLNSGLQYERSKAYSPLAQLLGGAGKVGLSYGLYDGDKVIEDQ